MSTKRVPIRECFTYGFRETRKHVTKLIPLSVLFFLPELSSTFFSLEWPGLWAKLFKTALFFVTLFASLFLTKDARDGGGPRLEHGKHFPLGEVFKWSLMLLSLVLSLTMVVLFAFAASPSLAMNFGGGEWLALGPTLLRNWWLASAWWVKILTLVLFVWLPLRAHVALNFFGLYIVDDGMKPWDAILASIRLTRGAFWGLAGMYGLALALDILGLTAWVIGAVFTWPVTLLATVHSYRSLRKQEDEA